MTSKNTEMPVEAHGSDERTAPRRGGARIKELATTGTAFRKWAAIVFVAVVGLVLIASLIRDGGGVIATE